MKVAYVAGPYRSPEGGEQGVIANINRAQKVAVSLWKMGFATLTPHLNSALLDGIISDEEWLKRYLELMCRCDLVVMVGEWRSSSGASAEYEEAKRIGIPVYHWPYHMGALEKIA